MLFRFTYNLILNLSYPIVLLLGVFSPKLSLFTSGRKEVFAQLKSTQANKGEWVWFHVASLGEFEQARPLMEEYKKSFPNHKLLLTFFSPSGYEVQKDYELADCICYLPWDTKKNVNRFLNFCNIRCAFFIKYEFWPNYFFSLSKRNITTYSVSSIFRPQQLFFKSYGKAYRKLLFGVKHFFVQNDESKALLNSIGIDQVTVSGDTRMDSVFDLTLQKTSLDIIEDFLQGQPCFVAGSTWPEDYHLMNHFLKKPTGIKIIIAPHEVSHQSIEQLEKSVGLAYTKWSSFDKNKDADKNILIVDHIGTLTKIYRYAKIAYIGGGMKKNGLHNTLEPAAFGIPVIIGKYFSKYEEAVTLVKKGGIFSVQSGSEFRKISDTLLNDEKLLRKAGLINSQYIASGKGASRRIINTITNKLLLN